MRAILERIAVALEKIAEKPAASMTLMSVPALTNNLRKIGHDAAMETEKHAIWDRPTNAMARKRATATGGDAE